MAFLGGLTECGYGSVPSNPSRAVELYQRAIDEGRCTFAEHNLADLWERGYDGVKPNPAQAAELFQRIIDTPDGACATYRLGRLKRDGYEGCDPDPAGAVLLFERAIGKCGDVEAMYELGQLIEWGYRDKPADPRRAAELYQRVINENGSSLAMVRLAKLLTRKWPKFAPFDPPRAVELLKRAAAIRRTPSVLLKLASLVHLGYGDVAPNPSKAAELYEEIVEEHNDVEALIELGMIVLKGHGDAPPSPSRAVQLFERAITDHGESYKAVCGLAVLMYQGGAGVPADPRRALEPFLRHTGCICEDVKTFVSSAKMTPNGCAGAASETARTADLDHQVANEVKHEHDMCEFAELLERGFFEIPPNRGAAARLLVLTIKLHSGTRAMCVLAKIVEKGYDEKPPDCVRALALNEHAYKDGDRLEGLEGLLRLKEDTLGEIPVEALRIYGMVAERWSSRAVLNAAHVLQGDHRDARADAEAAKELCHREIKLTWQSSSMATLGNIFRVGASGIEVDLAEAAWLYKQAIDCRECAVSLYQLGWLYLEGEGVALDEVLALQLFRRAAETGIKKISCWAMNSLAFILVEGLGGVAQDAEAAMMWYERAMEENREDMTAYFNLALLLREGYERVPAEPARAAALFRECAGVLDRDGIPDAEATRMLAEMSLAGCEGVIRDATEGVRLLNRVSYWGDSVASRQLGELVERGCPEAGIERNEMEAVRQYKEAVKFGDGRALDRLARLVETGYGNVAGDAQLADEMLREAVNQGVARAAFRLSEMARGKEGDAEEMWCEIGEKLLVEEVGLDWAEVNSGGPKYRLRRV